MRYVFGSSESERLRLREQSEILRRLSVAFLKEARIERGMRVLDLGCGAGDFSFLVQDLVGPTGHVTGIDLDPAAVSYASQRARMRRLTNVRFVVADVRALPINYSYDAIVGRFILAYMDSLKNLVPELGEAVKPRGIMAFQEWDHSRLPWSFPHLEKFNDLNRRIISILNQAGVNLFMAASLNEALLQNRFYTPRFFVQTYVASGPRPALVRYLLNTLVNLEKALGRTDVLDSDELQHGILNEQARDRAVFSLSPLVGVWTRVRG